MRSFEIPDFSFHFAPFSVRPLHSRDDERPRRRSCSTLTAPSPPPPHPHRRFLQIPPHRGLLILFPISSLVPPPLPPEPLRLYFPRFFLSPIRLWMVRGGTRHPSRAPPDIILLGVLLWIRPFRGLGELNLVTAAFEPTATATTTPSSCSSPQPAAVNVYHVCSDAQLYSTPTLQLDSKAMHGMLIASAHS